MMCPNCHMEMEESGYVRECPRCHFIAYFNMQRKSFNIESDVDMAF